MRHLLTGSLCVWASVALAGDYHVGVGDQLSVHVYNEAELSGEVVVTDACTVSLALIPPLEVCGLTTGEVEALITEAYAGDFLLSPSVAVRVTRYFSQRVDVYGAVHKKGPQFLEGTTSLLEVISLAGGASSESVDKIKVLSADGSTATYDVDMLTGGDPVLVSPGDKIILQEGEVVYLEGAVSRAGPVTFREGLTVTQALSLAGGADEYANLRRVTLKRASGEKERINIVRIQKNKDPDPLLEKDDYLIIPRSSF